MLQLYKSVKKKKKSKTLSQHPEQAFKTKNKIKCVFYIKKQQQLLKTPFQKRKSVSVTLKMGQGHQSLSMIEVIATHFQKSP